MSDAWDDEDRAIARALHVPAPGGPLDDRDVAEYREVLGHLPLDELIPRTALEERVLAAAVARRPAATTPLDAARARRRSRARAATLAACAVAAALVIAVLVTTRDSSSPAPTGRITAVSLSHQDVNTFAREPGARTGTFDRGLGSVALTPAGNGIFELAAASTVRVWLETKRGPTLLGAAIPNNGVVGFSVDHPDLVTAVRINAPDGAEIARAPLSAG